MLDTRLDIVLDTKLDSRLDRKEKYLATARQLLDRMLVLVW